MKKDKSEKYASIKNIEWYKLMLYPLVAALTIVISILSVNFDWDVVRSTTFWFKVFLKILILSAWVYFGVPDGKKIGQRKPNFVDKRNRLRMTASLIKDKGLLTAFRQYVALWNKQQRTDYAEQLLFKNSIDPIMLKHTVKELKEHYEEWDLNKEQLSLIINIKKGHFYCAETNADTYISEFEVKNGQEQAQVHEGVILATGLLPKVVLLIVMTFLTSAAIIQEKASLNEAIYEAISNLTLCVTSYAFAIRTGLYIEERYTVAFEVRENFMHGFIEKYENGKFVPDVAMYKIVEEVVEEPKKEPEKAK